jgi:hypothetical protein
LRGLFESLDQAFKVRWAELNSEVLSVVGVGLEIDDGERDACFAIVGQLLVSELEPDVHVGLVGGVIEVLE